MRNMLKKRSRAFITMGGMAVGIAAIVFLVSLGYGVQQLVIDRVARLEELRQADVSLQPGSLLELHDEALQTFAEFDTTEYVLPLISVVGRIKYRDSVSDVAVYGVTSEYLSQSAVQPIRGKIFNSDVTSVAIGQTEGEVAGVSTDYPTRTRIGAFINHVAIELPLESWIPVRSQPNPSANIIGFTRGTDAPLYTRQIWGASSLPDETPTAVDDRGRTLSKWLHGEFTLWEKGDCEQSQADCESDGYSVLRLSDNSQLSQEGYIPRSSANSLRTVNLSRTPAVLGDSISVETAAEDPLADADTSPQKLAQLSESISIEELLSTNQSTTSSAALNDFAMNATTAGSIDPSKTTPLADSAMRQAVVNRALLSVLGLDVSEAVGEEISVSFVATNDVLGSDADQLSSTRENYEIIGVVTDDSVPFFYVPFIDLRGLGINQYSQVKVVADDQNALADIRNRIEGLGYQTNSVTDTVAQIDELFSTARTVLAVLGLVALTVAALGMFNTLTVSLLERTREVGLMKTMGMRSSEVRDLFLTESMIMGVFGGLFGILLGWLGGELLSVALSIYAAGQGQGFIDVAYIPPIFMITVFSLSLAVGILTGLYPALRATRISPLDALRYE